MRRRAARASAMMRRVASIALSSSRHTGCDDGIARHALAQRARSSAPRPRRGSRRGGVPDGQHPASCASSETSRSPVEAPMKILTPAVPGIRSSSARLGGVGGGRADVEGVVAPHPVLARAPACRRRASAVSVLGLVLGISNTAVTPPSTAARLPLSRSSLCLQPRLAEMDLAVDHAGQHVEPGAVDRLAGIAASRRSRRSARRARRRRPATGPPGVSDGAVLQDQVVGRHARASSVSRCRRLPTSCAMSRNHPDRPRRAPPLAARTCAASCRGWSPTTPPAPLPVWAGLLTPQGKALFDFILWADGDDVLIDCEADAGRCAGPPPDALPAAPRRSRSRATTRWRCTGRADGERRACPIPRLRRARPPLDRAAGRAPPTAGARTACRSA